MKILHDFYGKNSQSTLGIALYHCSRCAQSCAPMSLYVYTENVDEFYQRALANQLEGMAKPEDMFWGDRMCQLKGPDGYIWCFASKGAKS